MLRTYADFIAYVEQHGVVAFYGQFVDGFPSLQTLAAESQWHTGDPETDPWQWKDRAAEERRLAFGCLLGGFKGFVAPALYPLFFAASRPAQSLAERYEAGLIPRPLWQAWQLFTPGAQLSSAAIRDRLLGKSREGVSKVDSAITQLQREYWITVCGNQRKIAANGQPYGWPANAYALTDEFLADWLPRRPLPQAEAQAAVLAHCLKEFSAVDEKKLAKALFKR